MTKPIDIQLVDDLQVDGCDTDYPDFCDAYFASGNIGGIDLTDDELAQLGEDYPEVLAEMALEHYL